MTIDLPYLDNLDIIHECATIDTGLLEDLQEWLETSDNPRLVLIDTLVRVAPVCPTRGDPYEHVYRYLPALKKLAEQYQVAIVFTHPAKKGKSEDPLDDLYGTTALAGVADTIIMLRRGRGSKEATMLPLGRSIQIEEPYVMTFGENGMPTWTIVGEGVRSTLFDDRCRVRQIRSDSRDSLALPAKGYALCTSTATRYYNGSV